MGGGKGGSADQSGMFEALISAQAAQQSYQLGQEQLDWTKQVWSQEQPMIQQVVGADVQAQQQQTQFAAEQQQLYQTTYQPLEQQYAQQAEQWASPQQQQINAAAAMGNVNEAAEAQRQSSTEQLESYGINPGSTRFAGLDIGSRTQQAAAAAGAGTQASQATLLQGLGLEAGVVNTGRGLPNTTASLTTSGVGAGSAAAGASQSNLATGSSAMTAPSNWYNTGAANMNTYVNAVNGYNQAQLGYAQVGAMQSMGMGSLAGGVLGLLRRGGPVLRFEKGGLVFQDGGDVQSRPIWQSPRTVAPERLPLDPTMENIITRRVSPSNPTGFSPVNRNRNQMDIDYGKMDDKELSDYHNESAMHHVNVRMDYDRLKQMKTDPTTKNYDEAVVRQRGLDKTIAEHESAITQGNSDLGNQRAHLWSRGLDSPFADHWERLTDPVGHQVGSSSADEARQMGFGDGTVEGVRPTLPSHPTAIPPAANVGDWEQSARAIPTEGVDQSTFSPETNRYIFRSGGVDAARSNLLKSYPNGPPAEDEGTWRGLFNDLAPDHPAMQTGGGNPMSPLARPQAVGLQHLQTGGMQSPEGGFVPRELNPNATPGVTERKGGPVPRYQDGGAVSYGPSTPVGEPSYYPDLRQGVQDYAAMPTSQNIEDRRGQPPQTFSSTADAMNYATSVMKPSYRGQWAQEHMPTNPPGRMYDPSVPQYARNNPTGYGEWRQFPNGVWQHVPPEQTTQNLPSNWEGPQTGPDGGGASTPLPPRMPTPMPPSRPPTGGPTTYQQQGGDVYAQNQPAPSGNSGNVTQSPGATSQYAIPPGGTPGGGVPDEASPSGGQAVDDVPARLTAGEFVVPKDVAQWKGHEYFVKQIDQARNAQEQFRQRGDIGGERGTAIPAQPTFVSRPVQQGMRTGSTGVAHAAAAIPPMPMR